MQNRCITLYIAEIPYPWRSLVPVMFLGASGTYPTMGVVGGVRRRGMSTVSDRRLADFSNTRGKQLGPSCDESVPAESGESSPRWSVAYEGGRVVT